MDRREKRRWTILIVVLIVTFMATLDGSIVNVALPVMAKAMKVDSSKIQIVVVSYFLVIVSTIMIFGKLGDIVGKTRVFKWGLFLFTAGSLLCGITNTLFLLVVARIIQGIGAAACMANNQGIITETFPAEKRGKALGVTGTFVALGSLVGPPLGGVITYVTSWQYIFLINVPVGVVTIYLANKILPREKRKEKVKIDWRGAALFACTVLPLFYVLTNIENNGINTGKSIGLILIAFVSFVLFIMVEKNIKEPLVHLELFKNKLFSVSILCAFISFVAIFCAIITIPFYLQDIKGFSPADTGLILMAYPLILAVTAPLSGAISDKIGAEILTLIGLILTSIGLFLMTLLNEKSPVIYLIIFIVIMSLGNGTFQAPNNSIVMAQPPKHKLGIAGSINALIRNLGMVFGVAVSTLILYSGISYKIGYKVTNIIPGRSDSFIFGMRYVFIFAGTISLIGAILTAGRCLVSIKNRKENSLLK